MLQLASGSIDGSLVEQSGPLWTLSQGSDRVDLTLASGVGKGSLLIRSAIMGLNDPFGWISIHAGDLDPGDFSLDLHLAGTGSASNLAQWMTEAGLNATGEDATSTITLAGLPIPEGAPSYFFWDLRDYNATFGTTFAVTGITSVPEPSAVILMAIGLAGLAVRRGGRRRHRRSRCYRASVAAC